MKSMIRNGIMLSVTVVSLHTNAQQKADIGVRFSGNAFNYFQLEYRKPLNDRYTLRLSLTRGMLQQTSSERKTLLNEDSLTIYRAVSKSVNYPADLRIGVERKLKEGFFSLHSDVILGYYNQTQGTSDWYEITDESGAILSTPMYTQSVPYEYYSQYANGTSKIHYLSLGLSAGLGLDVPFYRFILGVNLQGVGTVNIPVSTEYHIDPMQDFDSPKAVQYRFYPSAGVALRYVLGGKDKG